ncbi:MAG: hypothetical protein C4542_02885 [Dehalococcoidia bacterium]|nr:MAG: hypothetical protein C4542_02885 [Dehalococcoidia bacterium]
MKKCKCGGEHFDGTLDIERRVRVDGNGGIVMEWPDSDERHLALDYIFECIRCGAIYANWEDIPDAE